MGHTCALCGSKKTERTHMFPQNSRAEVQQKWIDALKLSKNKANEILKKMRQLEDNGGPRPRWCSDHFHYDDAGIHHPQYFTLEDKEDDDESDPVEQPKESTPTVSATATITAAPTALERALESILVDAGIPIPDTLQVKTQAQMQPKSATRPMMISKQQLANSRLRIVQHQLLKQHEGVQERVDQTRPPTTGRPPVTLRQLMSYNSTCSPRPTGTNVTARPIVVQPHRHIDPLFRELKGEPVPQPEMECNCKSEIAVIVERAKRLENKFDELAECITTLYQRTTTQQKAEWNLQRAQQQQQNQSKLSGGMKSDPRGSMIAMKRPATNSTGQYRISESTPRRDNNGRMVVVNRDGQRMSLQRNPTSTIKQATSLLTDDFAAELRKLSRPDKNLSLGGNQVDEDDDDYEEDESSPESDDDDDDYRGPTKKRKINNQGSRRVVSTRQSTNARQSSTTTMSIDSDEGDHNDAPQLNPQVGLSPPRMDDDDEDDEEDGDEVEEVRGSKSIDPSIISYAPL